MASSWFWTQSPGSGVAYSTDGPEPSGARRLNSRGDVLTLDYAAGLKEGVVSQPADAIGIRELWISFQTPAGTVDAVRDLSLGTRVGEFVSVVGPSGCGKTSLLRVVAGLHHPAGGRVSVLGRDVRRPHGAVGLVFQRPVLMPWRNVLQNVLLPTEVLGGDLRAARERAHELLALVGLQDFERYFPFQLSGGMQQRVALCRAQIHDPEVLLMDEPFGALDALTREQMDLELQRIWMERSKSVLFVTHSIIEAVFLSDRVIVMSPRPGRAIGVVEVRSPRPRRMVDLSGPALTSAIEAVRDLLASTGSAGSERVKLTD